MHLARAPGREARRGLRPGAAEGDLVRHAAQDIWVCENNHLGILSGGYRPGRYSKHEIGRVYPAGFIRWYMDAVKGDIKPAVPY